MLLRSAPSLRFRAGARALGPATSRHRASSPLPLRGCGSCARGASLASFQLRGQASAFPSVPPPPWLQFTAVNRQFTAVTLTAILSGGTAAAGGNPRKVLRGSSPSLSIPGNPRQILVCALSATPVFSRGFFTGFQPGRAGPFATHPPPSPCPAPSRPRAPPLRPVASLPGRCSCARGRRACPAPTCPPPAARWRLQPPHPPRSPRPPGRGDVAALRLAPTPLPPSPSRGRGVQLSDRPGWSHHRPGWVFCDISPDWFSLHGATPPSGVGHPSSSIRPAGRPAGCCGVAGRPLGPAGRRRPLGSLSFLRPHARRRPPYFHRFFLKT